MEFELQSKDLEWAFFRQYFIEQNSSFINDEQKQKRQVIMYENQADRELYELIEYLVKTVGEGYEKIR